MSARRGEFEPGAVAVVGIIAMAAVGVAMTGLLVWGAVHDAHHCTHWETYIATHCDTIHTNTSSQTTCYPVNNDRCAAWDDVGGTP